MSSVRIAVAQTLTEVQDRRKNLEKALLYMENAKAQGVQIICFPEGYPGPWTPPLDYDPIPLLSQGAKENEMFVAAGLIGTVPETKDRYYVKEVFISPKGEVVGEYRRTTPRGPWIYKGGPLWDFDYQEAGELPVFDTPWCKVGLAICSEVYVPEISRILALKGAELIFLPAGVPKEPMWLTWKTLIFARAIENLCFTATTENLFSYSDLGLAMICSPERVLAESKQEGVLVADCDLDHLRMLRGTEDSKTFPGVKHCKPGIFKQWFRLEFHGRALAEVGNPTER